MVQKSKLIKLKTEFKMLSVLQEQPYSKVLLLEVDVLFFMHLEFLIL